MIISERFVVRATRTTTAAFLGDVDEVAGCVPGVESVTATGDDSYRAVLAVRAGPIKARFHGDMTLDLSRSPTHLSATASGRDKATGSSVKVEFGAELRESGSPGAEDTEVDVTADVVLRGRLAQFGQGIVKAIAAELVEEFAGNVNRKLGAAATGAAPTVVAAPPKLSAVRLVVLWLRTLWRGRGARAGRK